MFLKGLTSADKCRPGPERLPYPCVSMSELRALMIRYTSCHCCKDDAI